MQSKIVHQKEKKISRIATIIVFLALIRIVTEPVRLQYYGRSNLTYEHLKPFLTGGLVSAIALLAMTIFSFYNNYKIIIVIAVLTIAILFVVKYTYSL